MGLFQKKTFLKGKYNGITEYLAKKTNTKDPVMLIYNHKFICMPFYHPYTAF